MKASELIEKLTQIIAEDGDGDVRVNYEGGYLSIDGVYTCNGDIELYA